jgi:hypothetical protein
LRLKKRHSVLLVAPDQPNVAPRAVIGAFSGTTVTVQIVLTGPSFVHRISVDTKAKGAAKIRNTEGHGLTAGGSPRKLLLVSGLS